MRIGVIVLKFIDAGGDTTAIEAVESKSACTKILRNGQVLIVREGKLFNLFGHHVE